MRRTRGESALAASPLLFTGHTQFTDCGRADPGVIVYFEVWEDVNGNGPIDREGHDDDPATQENESHPADTFIAGMNRSVH